MNIKNKEKILKEEVNNLLKNFTLNTQFEVISIDTGRDNNRLPILVKKINTIGGIRIVAELHIITKTNDVGNIEFIGIDQFPLTKDGFLAAFGLYVGK